MTTHPITTHPMTHTTPTLKPTNTLGTLILLGFATTTTLGLTLSVAGPWWLWLPGQLITAIALLQWFVLLHEAGHNRLFRHRTLNTLAGYLASYFTAIPFHPWRTIHAMHHRWTGWQDRDPTTASLVPRPLAPHETLIINFCWKYWLPLFSLLYRTTNFWHLPRLWRLLPRHRRRNAIDITLLALAYATTLTLLGPTLCLRLFALAAFLTLALTDPILFSQHNHIPQAIAADRPVAPHPPADQGIYTRSLIFPRWISRLILLNFDAHELHHRHPHLPGYRLGALRDPTPNARPAWQWIRAAKKIPASVIMFQNRDHSGHDV